MRNKTFPTALAALVLALLIGLAGATTMLTIDDAAFDYEDADVESVYLVLDYQGGSMMLTLSSSPLDTALPAIAVTVPDRENEDEPVALDDIEEITLTHLGRGIQGIEVVHPDIALQDAVDTYLATFDSLGFSASPGVDTGNIKVFTLSNGMSQLQVTFLNDGTDAKVRLLGL